MRPFTQSTRDIVCGVLFGVSALCYARGLISYLTGLQNPLPLLFAFGISLALALLHEIKSNVTRLSIVRATAIAITFALAVPLAHELRDIYIGLIADLNGAVEARDFIGEDYYSAMSNRAVGYGSCFGAAVLIVRWTVHKTIERTLIRFLIKPGHMPTICQHCNQPICK